MQSTLNTVTRVGYVRRKLPSCFFWDEAQGGSVGQVVVCALPQLQPGLASLIATLLCYFLPPVPHKTSAEALTPKQAAAGAAAGPGAGRASSGAQASASGAPAASKAKAQPFADCE